VTLQTPIPAEYFTGPKTKLHQNNALLWCIKCRLALYWCFFVPTIIIFCMKFILKYFPEITVKSGPVRKRMSRQLTENLRLLLRRVTQGAQVIQDWDKLEVFVPGEEPEKVQMIVHLLGAVPGIANFARVITHPLADLESIFQHTLSVWGAALNDKTFCVRVKRNGEHPYSSTDIERYVGGGLLHHTGAKAVDLHNPDVTVKLEVRDQLYIVEQSYTGLGGFPLGSLEEDVLALVSGGFDSTVASYQSIKRGLKTHYCFFNLGGKAHEVGVKEIAYYLWNRFGSTHRVKFVTVPFESVVTDILENIDPSCMGVILKRLMIRAACQIAERGNIPILITGEAIAQVSSQTPTNLAIIDRVSDKLILRPLAFMNKGEIIAQCRAIGAEGFAAAIPEYCGVISVRPSARLKLKKVEEEELKLNPQVLENALFNSILQSIDEVMNDTEHSLAQVKITEELHTNDVIIDIRHPQEIEFQALKCSESTQVLTIPFYNLNNKFPELNPNQQYLLYCAKGVMSQLHAAHLCDAGHKNVGVYRPKI
jgi:tRNA uracil 4-sulfurtransferase